VTAPQQAFRRNDAAPLAAFDELLAIGDKRRNRPSAPRDCDEMLVGDGAIAALSLHDAAYMAEITRSGLMSVTCREMISPRALR
jgi:ABC-type amino acid transport system permease subunit